MEKPNKLKEREETKTDRTRLNITGRGKHLQAAFQSIIIPLGVEYEREKERERVVGVGAGGNFAVVIITITAIIIIRVIPVREMERRMAQGDGGG